MSAAYVYRGRCDIKILPSVFDLVFMQKTVSGLLAITCLACFTLANASSGARVTAVASPAWIHQGEDRIELAAGREIAIGERVTSGENGRIEIKLWSGVRLRVFPESQISVFSGENAGLPPLLKLQLGRICLESTPASSGDTNFGLDVDSLLLVRIQQYGHICASKQEDISVINLRAGSVQIDNKVDPGIVILSEAGTVFQMNDDGAYQLLSLVDESEVADMHQQPFIGAPAAEQQQPEPVHRQQAKTNRLSRKKMPQYRPRRPTTMSIRCTCFQPVRKKSPSESTGSFKAPATKPVSSSGRAKTRPATVSRFPASNRTSPPASSPTRWSASWASGTPG
jgi:hypothetical protein